jgi:arabinan endo-1,5-alpha-L-arabinosidase
VPAENRRNTGSPLLFVGLKRQGWGSSLFAGLIALALVSTTIAQPAAKAPLAKAAWPPRFHDPSTPVREGDTWWVFATGNGLVARSSKDLKVWKEEAPVFREFPAWHKQVVPDQRGHLWAPDIVHTNGVYRIYYSVSSFGKNTSAIGLVTTPTLDPSKKDHAWTDRGIVVRSKASDPYNAIDPCVFIDGDGRHWMFFGSFWTGIQVMELDSKSGLAHPERKEIRRVAWHESIEAPGILKRGRFYYLFVNWGLCCRGVQSTYEIRIGRSKSITGPYLDKQGNDLATGGGSLFLGSVGDQIGPGHASFVTERIDTRMFHHFYDRSRGGFATIDSRILSWDKDGWPEVGGR